MATPGIPIQLDRPRMLKLTFGSLLGLEARLGKPSGEIFTDIGKMSLDTTLKVLHASLLHEDSKLRANVAQQLFEEYLEDQGKDVGDLIALVNDVVTQSGLFGRGVGKKEDNATT